MINKNYLKCESKIKYLIFLIVYILLYIPSFILYHKKNIWLICERGTDAQDNGYIFYKYLKEEHKRVNPHYVITKTSKEINKIEKRDVVPFCSLKHFMMCIGCKVQISSHLFGYCPWSNFMLYLRKHKTHNVHVFLQHGITYNNQYGYYKKVCAALDVFVCGSTIEQNYICDTLGYSITDAPLTGFARFDNLHKNISNNCLVIMPTWRRYLSSVDEDEFKNSKYFKTWISVLNNNEIKNICLEKNLQIIFYLHLSLQPFSYLFKEIKGVKIIHYGEENVQDLLKKSMVLLTDYSSVFFDCLYMNKSIILYQFDKDEFTHNHYEEGYFNKLDKNVIKSVSCEEELIKGVFELLTKQDDKTYNKIKTFSNRFFGIKDNKNRERIYDAIVSKL